MATKYYKARVTVNLPYEGAMEMVEQGDLVPADSPLLKKMSKAAIAEHFQEVHSGGGAEEGFGKWDVEQATAAPGEKRGTKK